MTQSTLRRKWGRRVGGGAKYKKPRDLTVCPTYKVEYKVAVCIMCAAYIKEDKGFGLRVFLLLK